MKLQFTNVGGLKGSFIAEIENLNDATQYRALVEEVRQRGLLMSSEVDVVLRGEGVGGVVIVGGWRPVGTVTVLQV